MMPNTFLAYIHSHDQDLINRFRKGLCMATDVPDLPHALSTFVQFTYRKDEGFTYPNLACCYGVDLSFLYPDLSITAQSLVDSLPGCTVLNAAYAEDFPNLVNWAVLEYDDDQPPNEKIWE